VNVRMLVGLTLALGGLIAMSLGLRGLTQTTDVGRAPANAVTLAERETSPLMTGLGFLALATGVALVLAARHAPND